jgi:hypothetical protein
MSRPSHSQRFAIVQIRRSGGEPVSYRLNIRQALVAIRSVGLLLLCAAVGFILFFREVELNRKISEQVMRLETELVLATSVALKSPAGVEENREPLTASSDPRAEKTPAVEERPVEVAQTEENAIAKSVLTTLSDLSAQCGEQACEVRAYLIPTAPGFAEGSLLFVLEAEVPRIGLADPNVPPRKRFFVQPGNLSLDQMSGEIATRLDHKRFRVSRALMTNAQFELGALLRPIAINAYVFDGQRTLIIHKRKVLALEVEDAE